ncbi:hypothetical protein D3C71_717060 [compost metagenome]
MQRVDEVLSQQLPGQVDATHRAGNRRSVQQRPDRGWNRVDQRDIRYAPPFEGQYIVNQHHTAALGERREHFEY